MRPKHGKRSTPQTYVTIDTTAYVYARRKDGTKVCTEILPVSYKERIK